MLSIIGGSGLTQLANLEITHRQVIRTPFGEPSGALTMGRLSNEEIIFLARHGYGHTIPPHEVNYRANMWAIHSRGVKDLVSVASVGGITPTVVVRRFAKARTNLWCTWISLSPTAKKCASFVCRR